MNIIIGTKTIPVASASTCMVGVVAERDYLLLHSDYTQLPDAPLTTEQKAEWATYRQQLRDYPDTVKDEVLQCFCQDKDCVLTFPTPPQEQ
jgi:hypothetical protein